MTVADLLTTMILMMMWNLLIMTALISEDINGNGGTDNKTAVMIMMVFMTVKY
jgi:hypothetical protein